MAVEGSPGRLGVRKTGAVDVNEMREKGHRVVKIHEQRTGLSRLASLVSGDKTGFRGVVVYESLLERRALEVPPGETASFGSIPRGEDIFRE